MNANSHSQGASYQAQQSNLHNHIQAIESAWQTLCKHWQHVSLTRLYRQIHSLTQDAAQQGYTHLSISTKPLEIQLQQLQLRGIVPNAEQQAQIQQQITQLYEIVKQLKQSKSRSSLLGNPVDKALIYLYIPDLEMRRFLSLQLELNGYIVQSFTVAQSLLSDCQTQAPHALVLAMQSPDNPHEGINLAQQLRGTCQQDFPIIFLSENNQTQDRLAALRMPNASYFYQPLDISILMQKLNILVKKTSLATQVLIVDENRELANQYVQYLHNAGIHANILTQPLAILEQLQQQQPEILLLHTQLKSVSSLELAMLIRQQENYKNLPILFFAQAFDQTLRRTLMHGVADDFLTEDISAQALVEAVKQRIQPPIHRSDSRYHKHTDLLTGLYHRTHLLDSLSLFKREKSLFIIALSLDNYRSIDNLMGVIASDSLLVHASNQLKTLSNEQDILARTHENGFAILSFQRSLQEVQTLAEQIRIEINSHHFKFKGQTLSSSCSIGIAAFDAENEAPEQTLLDAGAACSLASQRGGNTIQLHNNSHPLKINQAQSLAWEKTLREGLSHDKFHLNFQSIANLQDKTEVYYEVLLQIKQQEKQIKVAQLAVIAKRCGLSETIDRWMVKQAILTLKQQRQPSINLLMGLSTESLLDPYFFTWLEKTLRIAKLSKNRALIFDFSRKDINRHFGVAQHLFKQLQQLGCRLSIRDFETKNNSKLLLNKLPVHFIRISQHLVCNLNDDEQKLNALKTLIQSAHAHNKAVIAPFVESAASLSLLWHHHVDHIIGQFVQAPHERLDKADFR